MAAKVPLHKIFVVLICWFLALELFSRILITTPSFYTRYIKYVSDAGMRLAYTKNFKETDEQKMRHYFISYHPTRGWSIKPNILNQRVFDNKILNTNSRGIRGKTEFSYEKDPHKTRVLILGDSFTFGEEVSDTETYPYYLQQMLPQAEIINFGVPTYGQDQMLIYFLEEGLKYHPDIILLGYAKWENIRNLYTFYYRPKPRFVWSNNQLVLSHSPVANRSWYLKHEFWRSKFFDLIDILKFDLMVKTGLAQKEADTITDHILDKMTGIVRMNNSRLIFVPLSTPFLLPPALRQSDDEAGKFFGTWESKGISCIHLNFFSLSDLQKVLVLRRNHYKPFVNKEIAQGIRDYFLNNNLVLN